jgi:cobalt-zinc-cadmium efflux system outer membrane protein
MRNPELAGFSWEVRSGEARALQAGLFPNPEIEVEVEEFGGEGELSDFDAAETTVQLSQLIELAGKRSKRRQVAALERDLAGWDYETKRLDVLTEVTTAFVDVLATQERVALNEELVRLAKQVVDTVAERVRAGKVSPMEEAKAKVALAATQIQLERATRGLETARKGLAVTWGTASPTFEKVDGKLDAIVPIPSIEALAKRTPKNPDIARWATEVEQRQAAVELEDAGRIPDLTLGGGVKYFNETDDNAFLMSLSLPLPLFDRNQGAALEARHRLAKAKEDRHAAEVQISSALAEAYQALATSFAEADSLKNDVVPQAQAVFEGTNEGYREGKFDYLSVLDAQRTLFEAKGQYIEALATYHTAVAAVERLTGEPLSASKSSSPQE